MNVRMAKIREEWLPLIMDWRMRPYITKYLNTDPVLTLEGQYKWFEKVSADPSQRHWVILVDEVPVGVIQLMNIDFVNQRCESGLYIAERDKRSFKLAVNLSWSLFDYVFEILELNKVYSSTFAENDGVVKLNAFCGYLKEGMLRQHVKKNERFNDVIIASILREEWLEKRKNLDYEKFPFE